jgi:hypothetical protein
MFRNAGFIVMLSLLASMASHHATAADSCQPLQDAVAKLATAPTHIYATTVNSGDDNKPTTIEMIYAKGAVYGKVGGNWKRTNLTPKELVAQDQSNQPKGSCHYIKDESIGGETAAVYSEQSQSGEAQAQLWIAKSSGLLLREEMDIGSGSRRHAPHMSVRYEYANVQAPQI